MKFTLSIVKDCSIFLQFMWVLYVFSRPSLFWSSICDQIQLMNALRQPTRVTSHHDTRSLCYLGWVYRVGLVRWWGGGGCWRQLSTQQQLSAPSVGTCLPCTIPWTADCYHDCSWLTPGFLWLEDRNPLRNLRRVYWFETSFDLVSILVIVETRESVREFLKTPGICLLLLGFKSLHFKFFFHHDAQTD